MSGNRWTTRPLLVPAIPTTGVTVTAGPMFHLMHYVLVNPFPQYIQALPPTAPAGPFNPAPGTRVWFLIGGVFYTASVINASLRTVYDHSTSTRYHTRYVFAQFVQGNRFYDWWQMIADGFAGIHADQNVPITTAPPQ